MKDLLKKSSDDLKQNFAGGTFKKGGDQLSKVRNVGGDKITLSKKCGQMKKGGLVYTRGVSVFLLVFCR